MALRTHVARSTLRNHGPDAGGSARATRLLAVCALLAMAAAPASAITRTDLRPGSHLSVPHTITASAGVGGSIAPSGAVAMNGCRASQGFTITPGAWRAGLAARPDREPGGRGCDYRIVDVLVDGVSVGAVTSYMFTNVKANHTIAAS